MGAVTWRSIAVCGELRTPLLETWVADYRKHQMRPPTVQERKMYAEYVESVRGTSVLPGRFFRRLVAGLPTAPGWLNTSVKRAQKQAVREVAKTSRFCWRAPRVKRFNSWRTPLAYGS